MTQFIGIIISTILLFLLCRILRIGKKKIPGKRELIMKSKYVQCLCGSPEPLDDGFIPRYWCRGCEWTFFGWQAFEISADEYIRLIKLEAG